MVAEELVSKHADGLSFMGRWHILTIAFLRPSLSKAKLIVGVTKLIIPIPLLAYCTVSACHRLASWTLVKTTA